MPVRLEMTPGETTRVQTALAAEKTTQIARVEAASLGVRTLAIRSDGVMAVSVSTWREDAKRVVDLIDLTTGRSAHFDDLVGDYYIFCPAFSPNGRLLCYRRKNDLVVINVADRVQLHKFAMPKVGVLLHVIFSHDAKQLTALIADYGPKGAGHRPSYSTSTWKIGSDEAPLTQPATEDSLAFVVSPDGRWRATYTRGTIQLRRMDENKGS